MSALNAARLREPAAWIMLVTGLVNVILSIGHILIGTSSGFGGGFADRAASNLSGLTSPVVTALLLGAVLLVTKLGERSAQAKSIAYGAAAGLLLAAVFGMLALVVGLFARGTFRGTLEFVLTGVPTLALTAVALVYLLPEVLPGRSATPAYSQYGQSTHFGQHQQFGQPSQQDQQQFGQRPDQAAYGQPHPAPQPSAPYAHQPVPALPPGQSASTYEPQPPSGQSAPGYDPQPQSGQGPSGYDAQSGYEPQPQSGQGPSGYEPQPPSGQIPSPYVPQPPSGQQVPAGYGQQEQAAQFGSQSGYSPQPPSFAGQPAPGYGQQPPTYGTGQPDTPDYGAHSQSPVPGYGTQPQTQAPGYGTQPDTPAPHPAGGPSPYAPQAADAHLGYGHQPQAADAQPSFGQQPQSAEAPLGYGQQPAGFGQQSEQPGFGQQSEQPVYGQQPFQQQEQAQPYQPQGGQPIKGALPAAAGDQRQPESSPPFPPAPEHSFGQADQPFASPPDQPFAPPSDQSYAPASEQPFGQQGQQQFGQQGQQGFGQPEQQFGQSGQQPFGQHSEQQSFSQSGFGQEQGYAPSAYAPSETLPDSGYRPPAGEYTPAPYVPADSQPSQYSYQTPENPYAPRDGGTFADQAYPSGETSPSVPYPAPTADQQQPYYGAQSAFDQQGGQQGGQQSGQQSGQQGGQPFTGYSGHEYATPAFQEPDPPVDPRSQQLLDAYQQAQTYQTSTAGAAGTQPDLRVPDYAGQAARPYDDPFGHPQQQQNQYEPQQGQYEPQTYRPTHQAPAGWNDGQAESTMRIDPSSFGDALGGGQNRPGDDPIDPTAIYTPNEPRR